jgi:hypothetical protein
MMQPKFEELAVKDFEPYSIGNPALAEKVERWQTIGSQD